MLDKCSIVTDFGCKTGCEYCIWKKHTLSKNSHKNFVGHMLTSEYWKKVRFIFENSKKVDITGGGDPFYNINSEQSKMFYDRLCNTYEGVHHKPIISVHTSILTNVHDFMDQYVWHADSIASVFSDKYQNALLKIEGRDWLKIKKRVVLVADNELISDIYNYPQQFNSVIHILRINNIEFSIRQCIDGFDKNNAVSSMIKFEEFDNVHTNNWKTITGYIFDKINSLENKVHTRFIKQDDYSALYFMPNGQLYNKYLF